MDELIKKLRDGQMGWSGDAVCVDAGTAEEAADLIEKLRTALRRIDSLEEKNVPKYAQQIAREALANN